ncbi:hypothetical protein AA106556_1972 [Neokomagataea tanensis NBRC 106556]|uniref:Secreted protein n=1 Tax=Neokomagataea tanensis NBRC 106556 TaxID=1223519 RepID=A0ABQ0QLH1_9PROT|nr:hypothetical protein AA106556_1972 [Neokomagataea tanensis NBRC 106556]
MAWAFVLFMLCCGSRCLAIIGARLVLTAGECGQADDSVNLGTINLCAALKVIIEGDDGRLGPADGAVLSCDGNFIATAGQADIKTRFKAHEVTVMVT